MSIRRPTAVHLEALESRIAPAALVFKAQPGLGVPDVAVTAGVASGVFEDGTANLSFTFTRTTSVGEFTVEYGTVGGGFLQDYAILTGDGVTAVSLGDGNATGTVTFHDGETTRTVVLDPRADDTVEPDETIGVRLAASSQYTSSSFVAFGVILNDDTAFVSVAAESASVGESAAGQTFTLTRTADPSAPLTVNFHLGGAAAFAGDYALVGADSFDTMEGIGTVTFPAGVSTIDVTLQPVDDSVVEANESASFTIETGEGYVSAGAPASVTILDNDADVQVTVLSGGDTVAAGGTNEFTIAVRNLSAFSLTNISLTEAHVSALASFTAPDGSSYDPALSLWTIGSIAPGATATLKLAVRPASNAAVGSIESLSASVTGAGDVLQNTDDDTATASATVFHQADLSVTVTPATGPFTVGSELRYSIHFHNSGPSDADGISIQFTGNAIRPSGVIGAPIAWTWSSMSGGATDFSLSAAKIAAGAAADFDFTVGSDGLAKNTAVTLSTTVSADSLDLNALNDASAGTILLAPDPHHPLFAFSLSAQGGAVGAGALPVVRVFNAETGLAVKSLRAYETAYRDGVRVAIGDVNGDGQDDIITATRNGSGRIRAFDGLTFERIAIGGRMQLNAFSGADAHGAYIAVADIDGDQHLDVIAGSGLGGGKVRVFSSADGHVLRSASLFGAGYAGGVRVAAGDVNGDGRADIVAGQGMLGSKVRVLMSGETPDVSFSAAPTKLRDGVFVAAADVTGDGVAEIIVGRGKAGNSGHASVGIYHVNHSRPTIAAVDGGPKAVAEELFSIPISNSIYQYGARVAVGGLGEDRHPVIMVGAGPLGASTVQMFDPTAGAEVDQQFVLPTQDRLGIFVAASAPAATSISAS